VRGLRLCSATAWGQILALAEGVFDLSVRLPLRVSYLQSPDRAFFDGDVMFGESGWPLVASLATAHEDPAVNLLVVDPGVEYFLSTAGEYGGFSCQSSSDSACYVVGLFGESGCSAGGQIGYAAETVALFGSRGTWGLWVERGIAGVVVSAAPSALSDWELEHGPFLGAADALEDFIGVNFGGSVDSDFASSLRRNYGAFGED
jgi:hypothetical protein